MFRVTIRLIAKDISFGSKFLGLSMLLGFIVTYMIAQYERESSSLLFLFVPLCVFAFFVGKICYMDDKASINNFLRSLPIKHSAIVISRFVESLLSVLIGYLIIFSCLSTLHLLGIPFIPININIIILMLSSLLIYYTVYLSLYFKLGYLYSQNSAFLLLIIILIFSRFIDKRTFDLKFSPLLLLFSLIIFFLSILYSTKQFKYKV